MRKNLAITVGCLINLLCLADGPRQSWSIKNAFEQKLFIENLGQYNEENEGGSQIRFSARQDGMQYFFTNHSIIIKHIAMVKRTEREIEAELKRYGIKENRKDKEEREFAYKPVDRYYHIEFPGSGGATIIHALQEVSHTYNFISQTKTNLTARAFRKIVYTDLYPGIDMEFYFPEDKQGFKYNFVVHAGANPGLIQMKLPDAEKLSLDKDGNLLAKSVIGLFTDHAPVASGINSGSSLPCNFEISGKSISFNLENYPESEDIMIDPWTTTPVFTGGNNAYDVDWDNFGNCYVYGGLAPYQLLKFNSSGTQLWSFTAFSSYYGDFAVDHRTGSSYIVEGFNPTFGANIYKVYPNGSFATSFPGNALFVEMWRIAFSRCTNQAVIAGGGITTPSMTGCYVDTNLAAITPVNVLGAAQPYHDMWGLALDDFGSAYMSTAQTTGFEPGYDNIMYKVPLPTLSPVTWSAPTGYFFEEVNSVLYSGGTWGLYDSQNGLNGVTISGTTLYTYDSYNLLKWNANTGGILGSLSINGASTSTMYWGGLTSDDCDNIFLGSGSNITRVNGITMSVVSSFATPGTVYDVSLGRNNNLYACGAGWVANYNAGLSFCNSGVLNTGSSTTNATCGQATGSATVTASGGTGPYTYTWMPSGGNGSSASGLPPGTYTVIIADNSCNPQVDQITLTISSTPSFTLSTNGTGPACNGSSTGTATVIITGGTPSYTINWSNGQSGTTATGLGQGTYTLSVTDASGCTNTSSVNITEPTAVSATSSFTPATCGQSNGSASVNASGGSGSYTYTWTPSGGNGSTASGLPSGNYTCNITDGNGCPGSVALTITNASGPAATIASASVSCNGASTGSATVIASGGSPGYTYTWTPVGGNGTVASNLPAGSYTCSITDASGCLTTTVVAVNEPAALVITPSNTAALCGQNNGAASVSVSGGTASYTYTWTPSGGNSATASGLGAGSYTCTVTDANGCTQSAATTVNNTGGPTASISSTSSVSCFGGSTGSATANATGGTGSYTYTWTPMGGNNATASNLPAGTYTCTIADGNNCLTSTVVTITEPASALTASASSSSVNCNGASTGTATATVSGGTSAYTYTWSPIGGNSSTASGLPAGTYTCNTTDANGCLASAVTTISEPAALSASVTSTSTITCNGGSNGSATVTVNGGTTGYTYTWSPTGGNGNSATGLSSGTYTCDITDANGCTTSTNITLTQPVPLSVSVSSTAVTCNGGANGSANANVSGGTSAYTYTWVPTGGNSATATGLSAGMYTCNVTDTNGCPGSSTVTITEPTALSVSLSSNNVACSGDNNGSANATAGGGTGILSYSWSPAGGTASSASNLPAGTYTCVVTDANGCSTSSAVTITQPAPLSSTASTTNVNCNGGNDGTASVGVAGGTSPYNINWNTSPVQTGATAINLSAGSYTATVTDTNNCIVTVPIIITENPPVDTLAITGTLCSSDVMVLLTAPSGGIAPDTITAPYQWYSGAVAIPGSTTNTYNGTQANVNSYSVTWYLHGCRYITSTVIETIYQDISNLPQTNIFTPNDDKINDEFLPLSLINGTSVPVTYQQVADVMEDYELYVYDRWGSLIFKTTQPMDTWKGIEPNGKEASAGTYFWIAKYKTRCNSSNGEKTIKGYVQLIR